MDIKNDDLEAYYKALGFGMAYLQTMEDIELIIDKIGVNGLCDLIAEICSAKSDHIESNWQDEILAKEWDDIARLLFKLAQEIKQ